MALACGGGGEAPSEPAEPELTVCTEPRSPMCTQDYVPVCGRLEDGAWKTFGNACSACAQPDVVGHRPGAC